MPARMHEFYLREMYLNNLAKRDALTIAGEQIDLSRIRGALVGVSAEEDHIARPDQTFRINTWFKAENRLRALQLPPRPKLEPSNHGDAREAQECWNCARRSAQLHHRRVRRAEAKSAGSWWGELRNSWASRGAAPRPPPVANNAYPALAEAPGTYVLEEVTVRRRRPLRSTCHLDFHNLRAGFARLAERDPAMAAQHEFLAAQQRLGSAVTVT